MDRLQSRRLADAERHGAASLAVITTREVVPVTQLTITLLYSTTLAVASLGISNRGHNWSLEDGKSRIRIRKYTYRAH